MTALAASRNRGAPSPRRRALPLGLAPWLRFLADGLGVRLGYSATNTERRSSTRGTVVDERFSS